MGSVPPGLFHVKLRLLTSSQFVGAEEGLGDGPMALHSEKAICLGNIP